MAMVILEILISKDTVLMVSTLEEAETIQIHQVLVVAQGIQVAHYLEMVMAVMVVMAGKLMVKVEEAEVVLEDMLKAHTQLIVFAFLVEQVQLGGGAAVLDSLVTQEQMEEAVVEALPIAITILVVVAAVWVYLV